MLLVLPDVDHAAELRFDAQESAQQIGGRCLVALWTRHHVRNLGPCLILDRLERRIGKRSQEAVPNLNIPNSLIYRYFESIRDKFCPRKFCSSKR